MIIAYTAAAQQIGVLDINNTVVGATTVSRDR